VSISGYTYLVSGVAISGGLTLSGPLTISGSTGIAGQVLTSTGSGLQWLTSTATGNFLPLSGGTLTGPLTVSGLLTASGGLAVIGTGTATTVATSDNSTNIATTAFVQAAIATTPAGASLSGLTSAAYGNTALGVNAGQSLITPTVNTIRNTALGYNAKIPYPARGGQIVLGTSTESIYVQGGLYLNVGSVIADPLPSYLFLNPLSQFYVVTARNTRLLGTIQLPTPATAPGANVQFRFAQAANGLVSFDAAGANFSTLPSTTLSATITTLFTPASGSYVVSLTSDGNTWYQMQ